jgi:hypothetical protein
VSSHPAHLWPDHVSRSATFENPTASRGAGGTAAGGRKGAPNKLLAPGDRVTLADLEGPGEVRHLWLTVGPPWPPLRPAVLRAQLLEVSYGDAVAPSVSVPVPDFFGAVHGVAVDHVSRLTTVAHGGFATRVPMPFRDRIRIEYENASAQAVILYYQVDALLGPVDDDVGLLHATFRRENPTTLLRDFVITDGWRGPGRFLGWTGGVRVLDRDRWWGEGEVKLYLDGDVQPTICGTGTEDHVDAAWGLSAFAAPEAGAPLVGDEHVGLYRWFLSDPVVFRADLRATIQQIGAAMFAAGEADEYASFKAAHRSAGAGWFEGALPNDMLAFGLYEREDDWCATGFVYCQAPQAVPRVDVASAVADLPMSAP